MSRVSWRGMASARLSDYFRASAYLRTGTLTRVVENVRLIARILLLIEEHSRNEPSRYIEDHELAEVTGTDIEEVRRQMDVLESRRWTRTANRKDARAALIAPEGIEAAEMLRETGEPPRTIGF